MRRRQNIIAVSVFLVATLLVFLISPRNRQWLQSGFLSIISPFLKKGSEWDASWKGYMGKAKKLGELEVENATLTTEIAKLKAENQALRGVEAEKLRLQRALGYQTQSPFTLLSARVIGRPRGNWWSTLSVDKGELDGVQLGMCALTADGLVGKVVFCAEHSANILLVTDENCKVAARIGESREQTRQGIVRVEIRGDLRGDRVASLAQPRMVMTMIGRFAPLPQGQEVFTSGVDQVYPAGIMVGRVTESKTLELEKQAVIEPSVDLADLSDVFIVAGMKGAQAQK